MKSFSLLWSKILDSSIWMESKETRLVWITLLAMKDADGIVRCRPGNLAHRARVSKEECDEAIRILCAPDPETPDDPDRGIRIKPVDGGWFVINHEKYMFSSDAKRKYWREQKAKQREAILKKNPAIRRGDAREQLILRKLQSGQITQEQADAAAADPDCPV